jgi:2-iminoacetate synthase ThiH
MDQRYINYFQYGQTIWRSTNDDSVWTRNNLISPWISSGLNAIKSEASNASKKIIQDIASKPITNLITEHGTEAIKNLKRKAINKMQGGGKPIKKSRTSKTRQKASKRRPGRSQRTKKRRILDILD